MSISINLPQFRSFLKLKNVFAFGGAYSAPPGIGVAKIFDWGGPQTAI